ncbi:MAG: hypothetical protein ACK6A7_19745, partial [Planctomycetota bacterium]
KPASSRWLSNTRYSSTGPAACSGTSDTRRYQARNGGATTTDEQPILDVREEGHTEHESH